MSIQVKQNFLDVLLSDEKRKFGLQTPSKAAEDLKIEGRKSSTHALAKLNKYVALHP